MKCHLCEDRGCYREGKVCVESSDISLLPEEEMKILKTVSLIEKEFYCKMTRIEEIIEFSKRMGYKKIGIAFCLGLFDEAKVAAKILKSQGFSIYSAVCKIGGNDKEIFDVPKLERGMEAICNPVGQAKVLNREGTDLNLVIGLCVGHDILFQRYSQAPVSVLIVKDRVLGHNPVAALNTHYYVKRLLK